MESIICGAEISELSGGRKNATSVHLSHEVRSESQSDEFAPLGPKRDDVDLFFAVWNAVNEPWIHLQSKAARISSVIASMGRSPLIR
jgi:hypothetical protein